MTTRSRVQRYSFEDFQVQCGLFHDGSFEGFRISDHEMVFFLTSAEVGPGWGDEPDEDIELSNYYRITGRLHLLEPRVISINGEAPTTFPVNPQLEYKIYDLDYLSATQVELCVGRFDMVKGNSANQEFYAIVVEAREIYWENLPDLKMVWKPEKKEVQEIEAFFPLVKKFYEGVIERFSVENNQLEVCMFFAVFKGDPPSDPEEPVSIDPESIRLTFSGVDLQGFPLVVGMEYDILKIEFSSAQDVYLQVREYKKENGALIDVNLHAGEIVWERNPMWGYYEWPPMAEAEK